MIEILLIIKGIIERGLIFGMIAASVYLAGRILKFNNLSTEGAFGLGGAITALLINWQVNPLLTLLSAIAIGALSGFITALLHTKLKLNHLMSGIVVTTGTFSIILKIAGSNMALGTKKTIFLLLPAITASCNALILLALICCIVFYSISRFLKTEAGFLLQAVGDTPQMVTNVGKSINLYIAIGLAISNALAALAGALFVHYTGYFSIWSSVGILIIGMASMILAETYSSKFGLALIIGSIAYQIIIALTFELQIDQEWNNLITALLIILLIINQQWLSRQSELNKMGINNVKS
jgi:putative ABC transport system permease protein